MRTRLWARDTCLLADGTVEVQTMQREYLAIYVNLDEVSLQHPPLISVPSSMVL